MEPQSAGSAGSLTAAADRLIIGLSLGLIIASVLLSAASYMAKTEAREPWPRVCDAYGI